MCLGVPCLPSGPGAEQGADDDGAADKDATRTRCGSRVPTEAPSCWPTVAAAKATPTWATPKVPVLIDGAVTVPVPIAARISGPSTPAAYPVCGPNWASQTVPAAVSGRMPV